MDNIIYSFEEYLRQTFTDTDTDTDTEYNIMCYNIDNNCKYPFLKFMVTYDNDNNRFVFPKSSTIDESIQKLKSILKSIGCDYKKLDMTMYRGIYLNKYICFNISEIDVNLLKYGDTLFALSTEIINNGEINGLKIDEELTKLFKDEIELSILRNKNKEIFILPDVVYTFEDNLKESEFNLIFGNKKSKKYNCREYYYFYRYYDRINNILKSNSNSYLYVNRYALFVEGKMYFIDESNFMLDDDKIDEEYPEDCIIICYTNTNYDEPNMLVKNYDSFVSLSLHKR